MDRLQPVCSAVGARMGRPALRGWLVLGALLLLVKAMRLGGS
ncbi:hypothetical protein [Streptomyces sp. NPDC001508]